jgi:threonine synthase
VSHLLHLECFRCARQYPPGRLFQGCPACAPERPSNVFCVYDYGRLVGTFGPGKLDGRPHTMWRYRELLPVGDGPVVSLDEGMTPLVHCARLGARYGLRRLYVKDESRNPTWSFKDRMAAVAATKARELGCEVLTIGSTGNAGAATAAYAARAGMRAVILTTPNVPAAMRPFMQAYGATVVAVPTLADRWTLVREGVERHGWFPVQNFVTPPVGANPYALDGAKTVGFELCEQLGWRAPDVVVAPVSYGDLPVATWRGCLELRTLGLVDRVPRMMAAEVFGPIQNALARDLDHTEPMPGGRSVATSAAATNSAYQSLRMVRDTGGVAVTATDDEIMTAQLELAETEGIWAEPAAALPLAVTRKLAARGVVDRGARGVAIVTSTGLKDPEATASRLPEIPLIEPTFAALQRVLDKA